MKKLAFVSLILALILAVGGCTAESIFDVLPENDQQPAGLTAPSYGAMANVEPDQVEPSAEGGTIVTYFNVDASGYNKFGVYLGQLGFGVTGKEEQEGQVAYAVSNGQVDFVMIYNQQEMIMRLVYPQGTDYAKCLFPGYRRIEFNEEINVPGVGRITFYDLVLNEKGLCQEYRRSGSTRKASEISSWIGFHLYNSSTDSFYCSAYGDNIFQQFSLKYSNSDAEYEFYPETEKRGIYSAGEKTISPDDTMMKTNLNPLEERDYAIAFDLPENLRESRDGSIAILVEFTNGDKYVLMARENGTDLNIVANPE